MKINICETCQGTGEIREDVGTHRSEYIYHKCKKCNGTGRVKSMSYYFDVPYDMDNDLINEIDTEIIKLIRKL